MRRGRRRSGQHGKTQGCRNDAQYKELRQSAENTRCSAPSPSRAWPNSCSAFRGQQGGGLEVWNTRRPDTLLDRKIQIGKRLVAARAPRPPHIRGNLQIIFGEISRKSPSMSSNLRLSIGRLSTADTHLPFGYPPLAVGANDGNGNRWYT